MSVMILATRQVGLNTNTNSQMQLNALSCGSSYNAFCVKTVSVCIVKIVQLDTIFDCIWVIIKKWSNPCP